MKRGSMCPLVDMQTMAACSANLIVVPPVFILGNLKVEDCLDEQEEDAHVGNPELRQAVASFDEDIQKCIRKPSLYYDSRGRATGQALLEFKDSLEGQMAADRLSKLYENMRVGRHGWDRHQSLPRERQARDRCVYGFLASIEDMTRLDPNNKRVKHWRVVDAGEVQKNLREQTQVLSKALRANQVLRLEHQQEMTKMENRLSLAVMEAQQLHTAQTQKFYEYLEDVERRNKLEMHRLKEEKEAAFQQQAHFFSRQLHTMRMQSEEEKRALVLRQEEQMAAAQGLDDFQNKEIMKMKEKHELELKETIKNHSLQRETLARMAERLEQQRLEDQARAEDKERRLKDSYSQQLQLYKEKQKTIQAFEAQVIRFRKELEKSFAEKEHIQGEAEAKAEEVDHFQTLVEQLSYMNQTNVTTITDAKEAQREAISQSYITSKQIGEIDPVSLLPIFEKFIGKKVPDTPKNSDDENNAIQLKILNTTLNEKLGDNSWNPFKRENDKYVVDYTDTYLTELAMSYCQELAELVGKERLLLEDMCASGQYAFTRAWNMPKDREMTLAEVILALTKIVKSCKCGKRRKIK